MESVDAIVVERTPPTVAIASVVSIPPTPILDAMNEDTNCRQRPARSIASVFVWMAATFVVVVAAGLFSTTNDIAIRTRWWSLAAVQPLYAPNAAAWIDVDPRRQGRRRRRRRLLSKKAIHHERHPQSHAAKTATKKSTNHASKNERILYIVTTLAEYNSGTRNTVKGSDRLQETLIPILTEGVSSMIQAGYDVDVYLVCHFMLSPERQALVQKSLPPTVGLQVWNDATPLGYDTSLDPKDHPHRKMEYRTLHLARQHRFVIKDKFLHYDIFVVFEDDMLIKASHVQHFVAVTQELQSLADRAPLDIIDGKVAASKAGRTKPDQQYHGAMTQGQLRRMMPGFMRVEVLLDPEKYGAQQNTGPVPVDLDFGPLLPKPHRVNAEPCCSVSNAIANDNRPARPTDDALMIWETNILPLGVRQMPKDSWLDWVVLQRGPSQGELNHTQIIGDYWTNRKQDFYGKSRRPSPQEFKYINNQGGWMATQKQMWNWHCDQCPGGFLPPYEGPHYRHDGLDMRNVEWYSGGMQLSTVRHACNLQRIILLDPQHFSKSLLYHSANNKQRQLSDKKEEMFTKANTLMGQLNTIKKRAEKDM